MSDCSVSRFSFLAVLAVVFLPACTRTELQETLPVSLEFGAVQVNVVKSTLNDTRTQLLWSAGDAITVYNDKDNSTGRAVYDSDAPITVQVPVGASSIKATFPETAGSYSNPGFNFTETQEQSEAGRLDGRWYPLAAESSISASKAVLNFSPVGSAFALNVFNPTMTGEKLRSVSVRPKSFSTPVKVSITQPWSIQEAVPASKRLYPGQVYACVEKGKYSEITFSVVTTAGHYVISSNSTPMPLDEYDFYVVNLDLSHLKAYIEVQAAGVDGFTSVETDVTNASSSFRELISEGLELQLERDTIPDFSTAGYRWSENDYPDFSNVVELDAPSGDDDTDMIQAVIDSAPDGSVIQFQAGRYIVDSMIFITRSNVILRGSGSLATEIFARGTVPLSGVNPDTTGAFYPQVRNLISVGCTNGTARAGVVSDAIANLSKGLYNVSGTLLERHPDAWTVRGYGLNSSWQRNISGGKAIVGDVYCGSSFVTVSDASSFSAGDHVLVMRNATNKWIHDIKMDMIIKDENDVGTITQWTPAAYRLSWERVVKAIHGNRLYLDAPLVMSITDEYGGGSVSHCFSQRLKEVGIENLKLVSDYNPDRNYIKNGRETMGDIYHANNAVVFYGAEHCWVRNVDTYRFSSCAVAMTSGAKNITVENCNQHEAAAYINGGLRYAFHISSGTMCLVKNCTSDWDRHQWVTASRVPGPNVFLRCSSTNALADIGPHQRWATGTLYDNVSTTASVAACDAGNSGTGQGWQGTGQVFWCCTGSKFVVQDPWVTGRNYAIGCTFTDGSAATLTVKDDYANPGWSPDGKLVYDREVNGERINSTCRALNPGEPQSLFEYQLEKRLTSGSLISNIVTD